MAELYDCLAHIDSFQYPARFQQLQNEIQLRRAQGETPSSPLLNELFAEDVPVGLGIRALWCFAWRITLSGILCLLLLKGCIWVNSVLQLLSPAVLSIALFLLGTLYMTIAGTAIMAQVMAKRYHGYRIRIIRIDETQ